MEYRKICSECNEPSDEFNTDKYGKVICYECSAGSHCFCSGCNEYVPTSEINVVDSVLDVNGMEIEETNIYCSECNESIAEDEPSWCEDDKQICDGCADKPSQDHRGEDKPEEGKIYALTGGVGDKCIANGDSWKDSVVQNDEPKGNIGVWDIKFYKEDDEGNQTLYKYNGDCSVFSDMVDEDDLTEIKGNEPSCLDCDDSKLDLYGDDCYCTKKGLTL